MRALAPTLFFLLAACTAAPPAAPEPLAARLLEELEAGRADSARELFEPVADRTEYREKIYPVLYGAARTHYADGDATRAVVLLRFLHERYPEASSAREALVYALFLERAGLEAPDPTRTAELGALLAELRREADAAPVWLDLIEAQQALDCGDAAQARTAYARFLADWDRRPGDARLTVYVDDIGRELDGRGGQDGGR